MIGQTLAIAWKEIQILIRDRAALFVFFLMPLLLATIIGGPSSLASRTAETAAGEEPALQVAVYLVNQDSGAYGAEVVKALKGISMLQITEPASLEAADTGVAEGEKPAAIVIPAGFTQKIDAGEPTTVLIIGDPAQTEATGLVAGIVNQAVSELGAVAEIRYGIRSVLEQTGSLEGAPAEVRQAAEAQTLGVIWTQVQQIRQNPVIAVRSEDLKGTETKPSSGPMDWYIAGFAVMFAFFIVTQVAPAMQQEREQGTFRRLLSTPIHRASIIAGVMLAYTLIVLVQLLFMFGVGRLAFGINLGDSFLGLALTMLGTALAATTLGLLVGTVSKSSEQANSLGMMLGFVLAIVGGFPIPWFTLGGVMGFISNFTPHAHAIQAFKGLTVEFVPLMQAMPHIAAVYGFAVVFFAVALWRYRYE
jgi:linearmycin/streptolysin S transport system permease protein